MQGSTIRPNSSLKVSLFALPLHTLSAYQFCAAVIHKRPLGSTQRDQC